MAAFRKSVYKADLWRKVLGVTTRFYKKKNMIPRFWALLPHSIIDRFREVVSLF